MLSVKNIDFSGSYQKDDVTFLLRVADIPFTERVEKERKIQSGIHYSEMLSPEYLPTKEYLDIFYNSLEINLDRFSQDILNFASLVPANSLLVSLARAGTPIGVLVKRVAKKIRKIDFPHFSISIIRDRGIDEVAIKYIQNLYPDREIFFIDGWTGKGVIGNELRKAITNFNQKEKSQISPALSVIADISEKASFSVSKEDYLIPSSALNSTISGLVSRTVLNRECLKDFHCCRYYKEFEKEDLSLWFVEKVFNRAVQLQPTLSKFLERDIKREKAISEELQNLIKIYKISDFNFLKPGIAETTRVILRRVPERILIKNLNSPNVAHLLQLAKEREVKVDEVANLPYQAVGIIKTII